MEVKIKHHQLKFKFLAQTSRGAYQVRDVFYVLLEQGGRKGIGEIAMLPGLSYEDSEDFRSEVFSLDQKGWKINPEKFEEFPSIKFGLEQALLDLETEQLGTYFENNFLYGRKRIPINGLIWMNDAAEMYNQIREKLDLGYSCLKLKIGAIDWEEELSLLKYIRKSFSSKTLEIRVDANGAFEIEQAEKHLVELSKLEIHSIEQPIGRGNLEDMKRLCQSAILPIALDEELIGIHDSSMREELLNFVSPQYIILKPSLLGGFSSCDEWIEKAELYQIGWWITSALESNVGLNAIAQWTAEKETSMHQGLGTGKLFYNNIPSPLREERGVVYHDVNLAWDFSILER